MRVAEQLPDGANKRLLIEMAAAWLRLAEQADRNRTVDLVYETPPLLRTETPRQVAQQQQIQPKNDES
jgi:hypothetical protein